MRATARRAASRAGRPAPLPPGTAGAPSAAWRGWAARVAAALALFLALAKFVPASRTALAVVLPLLVAALAAHAYPLGVALYTLSFGFLPLLPKRLFGVMALNPLNLMVLVLLVGAVAAGRRHPAGGPGVGEVRALWRPLAAFLAWVGLSALVAAGVWGVPLSYSLDQWRKMVVISLPMAFGVAAARQGRAQRAFLAGALIAAILLLAGWAYVAHQEDLGGNVNPDRLRTGGRFGQPNSLGGFLALALPGVVALVGEPRRWALRAVGIGGSLLCLAALVNTLSRGSLLAAGVGLAVLGVLRYRKLLAAVALAAVVVGGALLPGSVRDRFEITFQGSEERDQLDKSTFVRREMYRFAPEVIRQAPLLGCGLGAYPVVARRLGRPELARSPHSWYIQVATELGLVGLLLCAWWTVQIVRSLWRARAPGGGTLDAALPPVMLASTAALAVICFFQKPFVDSELLLPFYFIGLGLAAGGSVPRGGEAAARVMVPPDARTAVTGSGRAARG